MLRLLRSLHALAVSLWFGAVVFFTIAALLIFQAFEQVSRQTSERSPLGMLTILKRARAYSRMRRCTMQKGLQGN